MNKNGQVTAFVIVGIILVAIISVIFILNRNNASLREGNLDDPESYISICLKEKANKIIDEMLSGGGFIGKNDTILYMDKKITYLCKNINNFEPCINQYPLYIVQIEKEFNNKIQSDAEECLASLEQDFTERGYDFDASPLTVDVHFKPSIVEIIMKSDISLSKDGISLNYDEFDTFVSSKIYNIGLVVNEIVAQEAKWCHFNTDGFRILYPEFDVRSFLLDDNTNIYTIKDKITGEKLMMATRGCAIPAGLF